MVLSIDPMEVGLPIERHIDRLGAKNLPKGVFQRV